MPQEQGPTNAQVQITAAAVLASPVVYAVIGQLLIAAEAMPEEGYAALPDPAAQGLAFAAIVFSGLLAFAGKPLRDLLEAKLQEQTGEPIRKKMTAMLIAMAAADGGAVLGLIVLLVTGQAVLAYVAMGFSFAGMARIFPTKAWLESA